MTETKQQRDERRLDVMLTCGLDATIADARAIATSDEAAEMVTVPREPTFKMVKSAAHCTNDEQCSDRHSVYTKRGRINCHDCHDEFADAYRTMLAAYEKEQSDG